MNCWLTHSWPKKAATSECTKFNNSTCMFCTNSIVPPSLECYVIPSFKKDEVSLKKVIKNHLASLLCHRLNKELNIVNFTHQFYCRPVVLDCAMSLWNVLISPYKDSLSAPCPRKENDFVLDWTENDCRQSWTGQPGLSVDRRAKMSLRGPLCQWRHCTPLSGTMTVLTVFRSVSELHKPEQGRAAEGVGAEATVDWTNIIATKAPRSAWKGRHWVILLFTGQ